jgi:hypothetical protein
VAIAALCAVLKPMLAATLLITTGSLIAQQPGGTEKKPKSRSLTWDPPNIDSPVRSANSSPPCVLADVLGKVGARTNELVTDLQNFTAEEKIAYATSGIEGFFLDRGSEKFDYVVSLSHAEGIPVVQENRNPARGSDPSVVATVDRGLPEMALMFLPNMQDDYEMKCEGISEWKGQPTWVVHFQQRLDKPSRTFSLHGESDVYPAPLKGHAWIAPDSGEVLHLETGLMKEIPVTKVHHWYVAIDYGPVQFPARDVRIWLPQIAESYYDFGDHRIVIYHAFTNFMLFWTQTDLKIGKPKQP